eukprot:3619360-Pyramimonas_sp.AAC.1
MLACIRTDEMVTLRPEFKDWPERAAEFLGSVPWTDDGRFLCPQLHWVRAGFGRCPFCTHAVKYKHMVAHNYWPQSYKSQAIENTQWYNGFELTVNDSDTLPYRQDQYISARRQRQGKASAD